MKRMKKRFWVLVLACLMAFSVAVPAHAAQGGNETVQPMLVEPVECRSVCGVSDSGVLSIQNRYTSVDDAVNWVVITTYVEKRNLLILWERVDIGKPDNVWLDYCSGASNSRSRSVQLPESGTYRITATFELYHGYTLLDTVTRTNTVTC